MAQRGPATPLLPIRPVTVHTLSPSPYSVRMHVASLADWLTPPGSSFFPAVTPAPLLRSAALRPAAPWTTLALQDPLASLQHTPSFQKIPHLNPGIAQQPLL